MAKEERALTVKRITFSDDPDRIVDAEALLRRLSDVERNDLRFLCTENRNHAHCAECEWPVFIREGHRRPHFAHRKNSPEDCPFGNHEAARDPKQIDAEKFHGQQESPRHKRLKGLVAQILATGFDDSNIIVERRLVGIDGQYCQPDVRLADYMERACCFEIQLATTQMPDIARRQAFYKASGYRLVWIVDGENLKLQQQAFTDIYLQNDCQIFSVDDETLETSKANGEPMLRLHRIIPRPTTNGVPRIRPVWASKIVPFSEINWETPTLRPRSIGPTFEQRYQLLVDKDPMLKAARRKMFKAIEDGDYDKMATAWNAVAKMQGGPRWNDFEAQSDIARPLQVMKSIANDHVCFPTGHKNLASAINTLALEPLARRRWTQEIERMLIAFNRTTLLSTESIVKKIRRNMAENGFTGNVTNAAAILDVFFPEAAYKRLKLDEVDDEK